MDKIYNVETMPPRLVIGRQTEAGVETVQFDCSEWLMRWPEMEISVWVTRPRENAAYPVVIERTGNTVTWTVSAADTAIDGEGSVEIMGIADDKRKISARVITNVFTSGLGNTQDVPEGAQPWVDSVIEAANRAVSAAEATAYPPIIGDNGNWWLWDANAKTYIDSGKPSQGGGGGAVQSVNGKTGAVELTAADVAALPSTGGKVDGSIQATRALKAGQGMPYAANLAGATSGAKLSAMDASGKEVNGLTLYPSKSTLGKPLDVPSGGHGGKTAEEARRNLDVYSTVEVYNKTEIDELVEQLKALILAGDTNAAVALLDKAILDSVTLA